MVVGLNSIVMIAILVFIVSAVSKKHLWRQLQRQTDQLKEQIKTIPHLMHQRGTVPISDQHVCTLHEPS